MGAVSAKEQLENEMLIRKYWIRRTYFLDGNNNYYYIARYKLHEGRRRKNTVRTM